MTALPALFEAIHRRGPISFADFMETALYGPGGFYERGGGAGRRRDFLTSPEVGPLFGAVLARALDTWWDDLGAPDPFVVVEAGASTGTLARDVLAAAPRCCAALRYVLVERSDISRARHGETVHAVPATQAFAVDTVSAGPIVTSLPDLPAEPFAGVIIANELLDNLPILLVERGPEGWSEVRVGERDGQLVEVRIAAAPDLAAEAESLAPAAPAGARIPLQHQARAWLGEALRLVERGRVVLFDYAATTPELAAQPMADWLRTYRDHGRGGPALADPGNQDVTCEVATDQLAMVRPSDLDRSQAEFLTTHGLDDLVLEARTAWRDGAARGDLPALRARSRIHEAEALIDPAGLGAFRALEWHR